MSPDDPVTLVFVTPHNFMYGYCPRGFAKHLIDCWYASRERKRKGTPPADDAERDYDDMLANGGTFAWNVKGEDGVMWPEWTIGWEHVLGMYIRHDNVNDDLTKLQIEAMRLHNRELKDSEKWKGEPDGD